MKIAREEIFGPVMSVLKYNTVEEVGWLCVGVCVGGGGWGGARVGEWWGSGDQLVLLCWWETGPPLDHSLFGLTHLQRNPKRLSPTP